MRVIGLISGTSVDGIDAALVEITGREWDLEVELLAAQTYPYPGGLRERILGVCAGDALSMAELASLDDAIATAFAHAAIRIQADHQNGEPNGLRSILIGSHGQTVYHRPPDTTTNHLGYSLQLGRGALIAQLTNITTVSNFRAADIAAGGQGAPLVPKVDVCLLSHPQRHRCIQNLGGIGNVAYLPPSHSRQLIQGWDTGPGNALLDLAAQHLSNGTQTYDQDGAWAATGKPCQPLVEKWLQHPFFHQAPPKSTGRELFGLEYFQQCLIDAREWNLKDADLLATLTELTVGSIALGYRKFLPAMPDEILLCGGGSRNLYLRSRLASTLQLPVITTDEVGLNGDFKEAIAFAVLAYWRQLGIPGNLPECTGARLAILLGDIHPKGE
ncbi:MAG: anhydro-N-acetylmuramic acid kinase [Oscillatoriaceae cyanobacterium]